MAEQPTNVPPYENVPTATVIYFDIVAANGIMQGAIEIELAMRNLIPAPDGSTTIKVVTSGRLRMSPNAAQNLKLAIENSLQMLAGQQPSVAAAGKLN